MKTILKQQDMLNTIVGTTICKALSYYFTLITKPEQSGKTFVMIQKMNQLFADNDDDYIYVNFIFCDNSLLLTKQTGERIQSDVICSKLPDSNETYCELSSSSRKDSTIVSNYSQARERIEDGIRNIVCCTNVKRGQDISEIISRLNVHNCGKYKFNVWFDEADKFCGQIQKQLIPITEKWDNVNVYLLTATSDRLFKKFGDISTYAIEDPTNKNYHGWEDNIIREIEDETGSLLGFVRQVTDEMIHRKELSKGTKGYVPAGTKKKSHYAIRDQFLQKGCAVYVVNGDGIELTIPEDVPGNRIHIDKTKTLDKHIIELYRKHRISRFPCIITGNLCISRGISIMHPKFIFDFGILWDCRNKSEASQMAGRLKGNIKSWPEYKKPIVYTTSKFNRIAKEIETKSIEIARLAYERTGETGGVSMITKTEAKHISKDKDWNLIMEEFGSPEAANKFLKENDCRGKRKFKEDANGFIMSSTTKELSVLLYDEVKREMREWSKVSNMDIRKGRDKCSRMYVCYKDLKDIKSVVYIVRIIKRKDTEGAAGGAAGGGGSDPSHPDYSADH